MSRLKELRLHGFKTFADPTRFVFQPGVNAVIGPNGSGKSNMADAVRWVLGEQSNRSLRTRRADDVIFAGSQVRKPTGMAEAVLTLDNADGWLPIDFAEVTIGRRAYRSGETEYLINGARARLRDVVELIAAGQLGASSLVVVGQGTVDAALSLRPDERRQLFEEAAGVKNLQVRKNEALARLGRAEENLARVADLVGELRPQVRRLALQAQHQQEHDALRERGRIAVAEAHRRRETALHASLAEARRRHAAAEAAAERFRAEQAAGGELLEAAEAAYWAADAEASAATEARDATREALIRLETRAEGLAARRDELEAHRAGAEAELRALDPDFDGSPAPEGPEPSGPAEAAIQAAVAAESAWRERLAALAQADRDLVAAEAERTAARRRDADALAREAARAEALAAAEARSSRLTAEHDELVDRITALRETLSTASARDAEGRADEVAAGRELEAAHAAHDAARRKADEARREATNAAERVAAIAAELAALTERTQEDGRLGQRLAGDGWSPLLDVLNAPDAAWPAIEAVVGGEVGDAMLWRDADPTGAARGARGTARLLDGRRTPPPSERGEALSAVRATQTLAEWIGDADAPGVFDRVAVAPDLEALVAGWRRLPPGWWGVTAAGDLADGRGILSIRGRANAPGGEAARQRARRVELAGQLETHERLHAASTERAAQAVAAAAAAQRRLGELRDAADTAEATARASAREVETLSGSLRSAERALAELAASRDSAVQARDEHRRPIASHAADHARLDAAVEAARAAQAAAAEAADGARARWQETRAAAEAAEHELMGARRRRTEREARRAQLGSARDAAASALASIADESARMEPELDLARSADAAAAQRRAGAIAERDRCRAELLRLERERSGTGTRLAELDHATGSAAVEVTRLSEALGALAREREMAIEAFEAIDGADAEANLPAGGDEEHRMAVAAEIAALDDEALEGEQRRVRRTLAQIGAVNPFAVEEHRELSARLAELTSQEGDLGAAIGSTRELIGRLEAEIAEQFGAAFRAIGERFDEFVQLLFAGGSASLQLTDDTEGEAAGGIEIVVRPPGKRLQRLAMLSGGERALTGVALLFAMLSVNPVPFCILDEVDAALDEANIGRFADALRRLAEAIDFVVITHNRATIEVADTIYGVTMTDAAVSRVLSLRLSDIPVEVGA